MVTSFLLVDDHLLLVEGLRLLINTTPGWKVVALADSGAAAIAALKQYQPDVVLLDVNMPGEPGPVVARRLLEVQTTVKIIMVSASSDAADISGALQAGAMGYVRKDCSSAELRRAIAQVLEGKAYLCNEAVTALSDFIRAGKTGETESSGEDALNDREKDLLRLVAQGLRSKEIAGHMGLTVSSVETYRSRLMKKLNLTNNAEMVRYAVRTGLVKA